MSRYFFHLDECGTYLIDEDGQDLPASAVQDRAVHEARAIIAHDVLLGKINLSHCIVVADSDGHVISILKFSEAVAIVSI